MPNAYRRCPNCTTIALYTYRAADVDSPAWPPTCDACGQSTEAAPQPGDFAIDAKEPFQRFDVNVDGTQVTIDSVHKLRKVEAESEQRYRNGEGEPLRFRRWSQTDSNKDVSSFGAGGKIGDRTYGEAPKLKKSGKVKIKRHGQDAPDVKVGPGMGAAVSALKG